MEDTVPEIELPDESIGVMCTNDVTVYISHDEYERLQPILAGAGEDQFIKIRSQDGGELIIKRQFILGTIRSTSESRKRHAERQASFSMERQIMREQLQARLDATWKAMSEEVTPENPLDEVMKARQEEGNPIPIFRGPHGEQ